MKRSEFIFSLGLSPFAIVGAGSRKPNFKASFKDPLKAICNYNQSFVTHITANKGNQARINIEGRCIYHNLKENVVQDFYKFASCKSENTYASKDLFMDPNYDFSGVYNRDNFVIFRSKQFHSESYAERGPSKNRFEDIRVQLIEEKKYQKLEDNRQIVNATLLGHRLVGRTLFKRSETENIIIEYPVKTINVNDIDWIYQVDTGPIVLPHPKKINLPILDSLELAFIAFNTTDISYFVFNSPTAIEGLPSIKNNHYSEIVEMRNVVNEIYSV
jgi:hypothetical protein